MTPEIRSLHLRGALGAVRTEMWDGREHLVVPVVALQEAVIHAVNAKTAEFVPVSSLTNSVGKWNGHPLVVGHPVRDGKQISAHSPEVLASHGFGFIRSSAMKGNRLGMEAMVDVSRLTALKQDQLLADLRAGKGIEVSVGAFVNTNDTKGAHNGKNYDGEWTEITPDHLAFLPGGIGACSMAMGCGAHRAAMLVTAEGFEALSNPEGINQYSAGGSARFDGNAASGTVSGSMNVKIIDPHSNKDKITHYSKDKKKTPYEGATRHLPTATVEMDRSKRGLEPLRFEAYHHTLSPAKGLSMNLKSLRAKMLALFDTPEQLQSEEDAEAIGYATIRELMDQVGDSWDTASDLVDELIAAEENTLANEEAETEIERARLESIRVLCMAMYGHLNSIMSTTMPRPDGSVSSGTRYMEQFRAAYGKTISAATMKTVQSAHNASHDMHSHTVALGAACNGMKMLAGKECETCKGLGQIKDGEKQADCTACDGTGLKAAAAITPEAAKCGCKETDMTKTERIAALMANVHNTMKTLDEKTSDDVLTVLEAQAVTNEKHAAELKAAQEKQAATDAALKAAQAAQIPADKLAVLLALEEKQTAADAKQKLDLVTTLKTAQKAYTEAELNEKPISELLKIAHLAKVEKVDYTGRGVAVPRSAAGGEDFTPPNPYEAPLKALQTKVN